MQTEDTNVAPTVVLTKIYCLIQKSARVLRFIASRVVLCIYRTIQLSWLHHINCSVCSRAKCCLEMLLWCGKAKNRVRKWLQNQSSFPQQYQLSKQKFIKKETEGPSLKNKVGQAVYPDLKKPAGPGVPKRSPIQVLPRPNVAWLQWSDEN